MSETIEHLRHKISSAGELKSVVRTLKALAAVSIGQYQQAVTSLVDYHRTVELGLVACLGAASDGPGPLFSRSGSVGPVGALVFGSDQGLVGQFNERIAEHALKVLAPHSGDRTQARAVGQRVDADLRQRGFEVSERYAVPGSVAAITGLVTQILLDLEKEREAGRMQQLYLFHNRSIHGSIYEPTSGRLLPFDRRWHDELTRIKWPSQMIPEVLGGDGSTLPGLVREYLFVSLYRICAESLAAENACRLAAMQRAEKNIDGMLDDLGESYNQRRQSEIDEELFDLVSGYEALMADEASMKRAVDNFN